MKKLLFTAVVVVAFSGLSKANTIEVECIVKVEQDQELTAYRDCLVEKFDAYNAARADGFSVAEASSMSYSIYFNCMGEAPISGN